MKQSLLAEILALPVEERLRLIEIIRARFGEDLAREWLQRNRAALIAYNEHIEKHGVFSEGLRSF